MDINDSASTVYQFTQHHTLTNWERYIRWRHVWKMINKTVEQKGERSNLPKEIALKEMMKCLVESDRGVYDD